MGVPITQKRASPDLMAKTEASSKTQREAGICF